MKKIVIIVLILLLLFSLGILSFFFMQTKQKSLSTNRLNESAPTSLPTLAGITTTYIGTLPCADCSGLKMQLTLYRNNLLQDSGLYELQSTYLGTKSKAVEVRGAWKTIRGSKTNRNAIIYELIPDKSSDVKYFLKVNDNKITLLNKQIGEIQSSFNYTLTKQ